MAKSTSSVHNINSRPDFGSRFLKEDSDVWSHNAWDHVEPPPERMQHVEEALQLQRASPVPTEEHPRYNERPARHWDAFYKNNSANFFKDRKWLQLEFPEIANALEPDAGSISILEVGCGVGNSILPVLQANKNPELRIHACDYSSKAIDILRSSPKLTEPCIGNLDAFVWDLVSPDLPQELAPHSIDILIMVFVLSALHPKEWPQAIENASRLLKPGGSICFRDYGRHDLTQVRFKKGRLLQENFYIRGDSTRVYFFDLDELSIMFSGTHLSPDVTISPNDNIEESELDTPDGIGDCASSSNCPEELPHNQTQEGGTPFTNTNQLSHFRVQRMGIDRRLLVNRKRQLKMYRVWVQAVFVKHESQ